MNVNAQDALLLFPYGHECNLVRLFVAIGRGDDLIATRWSQPEFTTYSFYNDPPDWDYPLFVIKNGVLSLNVVADMLNTIMTALQQNGYRQQTIQLNGIRLSKKYPEWDMIETKLSGEYV